MRSGLVTAATTMVVAAAAASVLNQTCVDRTWEAGVTCPSAEDWKYPRLRVPVKESCAEYWDCENGCAKKCPDGQYFQDWHWEGGECTIAQYVECGPRPCPSKTCISDVTSAEPADVAAFCSSQGRGRSLPDAADCSQFYFCGWFDQVLRRCPLGPDGEQWLFNNASETCDFARNVVCGDRPVCDGEGECGEQVMGDACDGVDCAAQGDEYRHREGECARCACRCCSGKATETCCREGNVWDARLDVCVARYDQWKECLIG